MPAGKGTRTSKLKQLEDYKRRMRKKPMGGPSKLRPPTKQPPKSKTPRNLPDVIFTINDKNYKIKERPNRPGSFNKSRGTGGVNRGGFRKPDPSRIRPGILSNRKKVNKAG
jgi:hypothetical protein